MPSPLELLAPDAEQIPEWLAGYHAGDPFPREAFFASRILYYPGSATDGHPLRIFGKARAVHCFAYADYALSRAELLQQLTDETSPGHPKGYRALSPVDVSEDELTPRGWVPHLDMTQCQPNHLADTRPPEGPFVVFAVLERLDTFGEDHGAKRLAILHVGGDGYATFDALFCQNGSQLPYAVLLQDHGYGGNWNDEGFGGESPLWSLATRTGFTLPKWLFAPEPGIGRTLPWPGYAQVSGSDNGGMHWIPRCLFQQNNV